ncbi:MAG: HD domain-containing protein [Coriobacteriia bacterium]
MAPRPTDSHNIGMPGQALFLAALLALSAGGLWLVWSQRLPDFSPVAAAGLVAAFFAVRLMTIRLPQGDDVYVTVAVGLVGLAIADVATVMVAFAVAASVESVARFSPSSKAGAVFRLLDGARGTAVIGLMAPWQLLLHADTTSNLQSGDLIIAWLLAVGFVWVVVDLLTISIQQSISGGQSVVQGMSTLLRPLLSVYLVHVSMAAVAVRLYVESGAWSLPVALLLTLILQNSFNLFLRIRRAYSDTIGALAHAAELDRPHDSGHARRVADLAVAVGRRMGLSSLELERIGYAALLHDIGRMGDVGEDPSGVHARRGAEIVGSVPFLKDVAPLIDGAEGTSGGRQPIGADIVRTCSHYDRLRGERGAEAAMEALAIEAGGLQGRVLEALDEVVRAKTLGSGVGR